MQVLLVEDDIRVAAALVRVLRRRGCTVTCVTTVAEALAAPMVDLVLLDMGLPDGDGLEVCRSLRQRSRDVSIIVVSARGEEYDRVAGLRTGADDYLVKPFSMVELHARIEAVMRRAARSSSGPEEMWIGSMRVDVTARQVSIDGQRVQLTRKEFEILVALARRPGTAVSRKDLLLAVWNTTEGAERTLEVHIAALRAKLGDAGLVRTVRGVGYQLQAG
ncbi:response regulator transcription factor [Micromonospora sp. PLK6-60]|uniref:response regulator transcription factor n=1 Tax=Micromonospora sp. PLK6-60 TaxID=2873383 RepID=UPI001CA75392|nr:response regulator transcription factor [Micromonospora sp. PLK6-60]MBY8870988.1 response regulator transcription factor [Micromonospora sp. PLK6-60]